MRNGSSVICRQCSSRSSCESAQSDLRATLSAIYRLGSHRFISDRVALRSDRADAQADLALHWPHISKDPFSHDAAHFVLVEDSNMILRTLYLLNCLLVCVLTT